MFCPFDSPRAGLSNPFSRRVGALAVTLTCLMTAFLAIGPAPAASAADAAPTSATSLGPLKYYVVQSSFRGQKEFLFEIAERFTGDGDRFGEIFTLNQNRLQPDGSRLTSPTALDVGWLLILPGDARGAGIRSGPLPCCATPAADGAGSAEPGAATGTVVPPATRSSAASAPSNAPAPKSVAANSQGSPKSDHANLFVVGTILLAVLVGIILFILWPRQRDARRRNATTEDDSSPPAAVAVAVASNATVAYRPAAAATRVLETVSASVEIEAPARRSASGPNVIGVPASAPVVDDAVVAGPAGPPMALVSPAVEQPLEPARSADLSQSTSASAADSSPRTD